MPTVLLIDDDPSLLDLVAMAVEDAGHTVLLANDGRAGLALVPRAQIVVSDVNLPGLDGFSLCRAIRAAGNPVPIILLTARDTEIDEALGLDLGADDYVTKPFSARVLVARLSALLRRAAPAVAAPVLRRVGALTLDPERLDVRWGEQAVAVTVTEFRLLDALTERPGAVRSRAWLMERARGDDSVVVDRIVDTYVRRLRRKLEATDASFDRIETLVGAGYRWRE